MYQFLVSTYARKLGSTNMETNWNKNTPSSEFIIRLSVRTRHIPTNFICHNFCRLIAIT